MDRVEAIKRLTEIQQGRRDVEVQHGEADDVLCALLRSLGYEDVVEAWEAVEKWYA